MADENTHEYVKNLANKLGISQPKCLAMMIDEKKHRDKLDSKRKAEEFEELDIQTALSQINRRLEKIEKRENPRDTIVSFFRTQETTILKPMNEMIEAISFKLQEIIDALNNI
jgi:hypothetical protein